MFCPSTYLEIHVLREDCNRKCKVHTFSKRVHAFSKSTYILEKEQLMAHNLCFLLFHPDDRPVFVNLCIMPQYSLTGTYLPKRSLALTEKSVLVPTPNFTIVKRDACLLAFQTCPWSQQPKNCPLISMS
jgi:hypothetical protein